MDRISTLQSINNDKIAEITRKGITCSNVIKLARTGSRRSYNLPSTRSYSYILFYCTKLDRNDVLAFEFDFCCVRVQMFFF